MSTWKELPRPATPGPWETREGSSRVYEASALIDCVCTMQVSNQPDFREDAAAIAALPDYVAEVDRLRAWCLYYQDHNAYEMDLERLHAGEWPYGSRQ